MKITKFGFLKNENFGSFKDEKRNYFYKLALLKLPIILKPTNLLMN